MVHVSLDRRVKDSSRNCRFCRCSSNSAQTSTRGPTQNRISLYVAAWLGLVQTESDRLVSSPVQSTGGSSRQSSQPAGHLGSPVNRRVISAVQSTGGSSRQSSQPAGHLGSPVNRRVISAVQSTGGSSRQSPSFQDLHENATLQRVAELMLNDGDTGRAMLSVLQSLWPVFASVTSSADGECAVRFRQEFRQAISSCCL